MTQDTTPNDTRADERPTVEFQPRLLPDGSTPPNPTDAEAHYQYSLQTSSQHTGELISDITEHKPTIGDASKAGWVMYYPDTLKSIVSDAEPPQLQEVGDENGATRFVESSEIRDDVFIVDTNWNVKIPPGTVLHAYPLFNHAPGGTIKAIPSIIARSEGETAGDEEGFVPVRIRVQVNGSGTVSTKDACVQLLLTENISREVPYEALSQSELEEVNKQDRAMKIYPDWYPRHNASDER